MSERIPRRSFVKRMAGAAALTGAATSGHSGQAAGRHPNVVVIFADDLGYGDVGCYGCPDIRTPAIDGLAGQGVRFTNFYANGPECTPTRTAFMTGRYQQRVGGLECAIGVGNVGRYDDAIRLAEQHRLGLPVEATSIARLLKDAGYATAGFGKWHLGYEPAFSPRRHGFDYFFGLLGGTVDYHHHTEPDGTPMLYENGERVRREGYLTDLITAGAVDFLRRRDGSPFFLYVPYTAPHTPYQRAGEKREKPVDREEWNKGTRETFAWMVERMDAGIGRILDGLDERGLAHDTVVIFASDNGANRTGRNAPFSGHKGGLFEGGIRVPCIVRWPGRVKPRTVADHMTLTMDLTASIARIAGVQPPPGRPFDGIDIVRAIERERPARERTLFWRARRGERTWKAVRDGSMKYISRRDGETVKEYLFDLAGDPTEEHTLLAERPDEARRLQGLLAEWEREVRPVR